MTPNVSRSQNAFLVFLHLDFISMLTSFSNSIDGGSFCIFVCVCVLREIQSDPFLEFCLFLTVFSVGVVIRKGQRGKVDQARDSE